MNKLIVITLVLSAVLLAGCRTPNMTSYPSYRYQPYMGDQQAAQQEYLRNVQKWQEEQQNLDRFINNGRIDDLKTKRYWWQWW
ncbi:MAG: hypothetical protein JW957_09250 [Candidatus Omnitrophica bacterium]|nr:hypothetical protein [Candidatus Omnitrophota bacterium]